MPLTKPIRDHIQALKTEYDQLRVGKESLLTMIDEVEIPESVYNSNAIENSSLTLKETEKILLEQELARDVSLREVFEAINLARVVDYIRTKATTHEVDTELILLLHRMLIGGIKDDIAGRFRKKGEYVRVGGYIAPAPEQVAGMIDATLLEYTSTVGLYPIDKIAKFHLDFETIHPFTDGNGRTARALATLVLYQRGYDFRRLFALEDYYNEDRPAYYAAINIGKNYTERRIDFTPWLEYFVRGVEVEISMVKNSVASLAAKGIGKQVGERVFLDKDQLKIIDFIEHMGRVTSKDVMDILNCPQRTAQFYLKRLKEMGVIISVGKGRATYYVLQWIPPTRWCQQAVPRRWTWEMLLVRTNLNTK